MAGEAVTRMSVQLDDGVRRSERVEDGETASLARKKNKIVSKFEYNGYLPN